MNEYEYVHVCMYYVHGWYPQKPEEGLEYVEWEGAEVESFLR